MLFQVCNVMWLHLTVEYMRQFLCLFFLFSDHLCSTLLYIEQTTLESRLCVISSNKMSLLILFISYLSYQLHCCTLPDKRCLSHGMLPLSGHDDLHFLNNVANDAESTYKSKRAS